MEEEQGISISALQKYAHTASQEPYSSEVKDGSAPQPAAKSRVLLLPRTAGSESNLTRWVNSSDDGQFEFHGVFPGSYYLVAIATGNPAQLTARKPVEIRDSDLLNQSITAARGFDISGSIHFQDWQLGPPPDYSQLAINLVADITAPIDRSFRGYRFTPATVTIVPSSNGQFNLRDIAPGDYRVIVSLNPQTRDGCKTAVGSEGGIYVVGADWDCRCLKQRIARGRQARWRTPSGSGDKFRIDIRTRAGCEQRNGRSLQEWLSHRTRACETGWIYSSRLP